MPGIGNRLAVRLALLLTLALAPLGMITLYSEHESWTAEQQAFEADLMARTVERVTGPVALLRSAMTSAHSLGPEILALQDDPDACSERLQGYVAEAGFFAFAGFVGADGRMACRSAGAAVDFSDDTGIAALLDDPRPAFGLRHMGVATTEPVLVAKAPVYRDGALAGVMTIAIARHQFDLLAAPADPEERGKHVFLVNAAGAVLSNAQAAEEAALLPAPEALRAMLAQAPLRHGATARDGSERLFTLAELIPRQLYVIGSWGPETAPASGGITLWRLGFPVLMWLASVAVVMLAIHQLVVRHLRQINRKMRRFALGSREDFARLPDSAPHELREIDTTFAKMALLIGRDEAELEEALREKTMLVREVHHRVKNNLQLIASILSLQIRRLKDPEARAILNGVQARVRSLATIHRTLYDRKRFSESDAAAFFETILDETLALARSEVTKLHVERELEPLAVPPERIIPAALFFAEALTNALKYAAPPAPGAPPHLCVICRSREGLAEIAVQNSLAEPSAGPRPGGLGQELMASFAAQIGAEIESGPVTDSRGAPAWRTGLRLKLAGAPSGPEAQAEAQAAPATPAPGRPARGRVL